jgi:hypothetical protein
MIAPTAIALTWLMTSEPIIPAPVPCHTSIAQESVTLILMDGRGAFRGE